MVDTHINFGIVTGDGTVVVNIDASSPTTVVFDVDPGGSPMSIFSIDTQSGFLTKERGLYKNTEYPIKLSIFRRKYITAPTENVFGLSDTPTDFILQVFDDTVSFGGITGKVTGIELFDLDQCTDLHECEYCFEGYTKPGCDICVKSSTRFVCGKEHTPDACITAKCGEVFYNADTLQEVVCQTGICNNGGVCVEGICVKTFNPSGIQYEQTCPGTGTVSCGTTLNNGVSCKGFCTKGTCVSKQGKFVCEEPKPSIHWIVFVALTLVVLVFLALIFAKKKTFLAKNK
jgi:hypothetical protein